MSPHIPKSGQRLLSLDIMRGITVTGMILVNNPGNGDCSYEPLHHAAWNGLTPTDLVFPFFMFIMGISTYMSLRKSDFRSSIPLIVKILRRSVVIFAIGLAITWFGLFMRGINSGAEVLAAALDFSHLRLLGVLPRLALCYCVASIVAVTLRHRYLPFLVVTLLVTYTAVLLAGHGWEFSGDNVISIVDHKVLGADHMHTTRVDGVAMKFDPEGLLSTLPSIAHVLIGFLCGMTIMSTSSNRDRINKLFIIGTVLTFAGLLLSYGLPINKRIWSPTFVLTTCGMAASLLALLVWAIDIKGWKRWTRFFHVFGVNPLFLYVLSEVMEISFGYECITVGAEVLSVRDILFGWFYSLPGFAPSFASLCYTIVFVLLNWLVGLFLYRKNIYIKI